MKKMGVRWGQREKGGKKEGLEGGGIGAREDRMEGGGERGNWNEGRNGMEG